MECPMDILPTICKKDIREQKKKEEEMKKKAAAEKVGGMLFVNCTSRKEGNVLFNDALNTFYLWLYGVRDIVKDHSDCERKPAPATWSTLSD